MSDQLIAVYPAPHPQSTVKREFLRALMLPASSLDRLTPVQQQIAELQAVASENATHIRELAEQLRPLENDVSPEHHPPAASRCGTMDLQQEIEINPLATVGLHLRLAAAQPKVKCLIAPHVQQPARKVRQKLVVERFNERKAHRIERIEAEPVRHVLAGGEGEPIRRLGEVAILRMLEPPLQVAEGLLIRDQLDEPGLAVRVELPNLVRRHG